jgi:hypothetical protein
MALAGRRVKNPIPLWDSHVQRVLLRCATLNPTAHNREK